MKRLLLVLAIGCIDEIDVGSRATFFGGDLPREWKTFSSPVSDLLHGIDGVSDDAVWAVGERGVILRFDGTQWTREDSPIAEDLFGVFAAAENDVWAVGDGGAILHRDGMRWSRVNGVVPPDIVGDAPRLVDIGGTGKDDIWVLPEGTLDLAGEYDHGAIHYDGRAWSVFRRPDADGTEEALAAGGGGTAWLVTGSSVQAYRGSAWVNVGSPTSSPLFSFEDAWADQRGRIWALGSDTSRARIFRYDGVWTELEGDGIAQESLHLFSIAGAQPAPDEIEVLAVGDGSALARYDGGEWKTLIESSYSKPNLLAMSIVLDRIWAVGADGTIVRAE